MRILIFDTETTGLPTFDYSKNPKFGEFYPPNLLEYYNSARLVELAYIIYDSGVNDNEEVKVKTYESLVIPHFEITNSDIHGITTEQAKTNGKDLTVVLNDFYNDLKTVDVIVGHNVKFDINIVASECSRNNLLHIYNLLLSIKNKCTLNMSRQKYGRGYKLLELYPKLTKKEWVQSHRALDDSEKCAEVYFIMTTSETRASETR